MIKMIGEVSYDLHPHATYVRVSIPQHDGVPLALKVTREGFDRHLFKKGRVVEVRESCEHDRRRFAVSRVFDESKSAPVNVTFKIKVRDVASFGSKKEKVKFYIGPKYFEHPEMQAVLNRTLSIRPGEFHGVRHRDAGLSVICTTDQFTRFLIDRNLNGIKNGFMDLNPKLIRSEPKPDAYQALADIAGITRDQAKKVSYALCYSGPDEIGQRIKPSPHREHHMLDVSDR